MKNKGLIMRSCMKIIIIKNKDTVQDGIKLLPSFHHEEVDKIVVF